MCTRYRSRRRRRPNHRPARRRQRRGPVPAGGLNAFDTDAAALDALRSIDESRRYRFGDAGGGGLDGDLHAARRLGDAHASELGRAIDDQQPSLAEAFVVVSGSGAVRARVSRRRWPRS